MLMEICSVSTVLPYGLTKPYGFSHESAFISQGCVDPLIYVIEANMNANYSLASMALEPIMKLLYLGDISLRCY